MRSCLVALLAASTKASLFSIDGGSNYFEWIIFAPIEATENRTMWLVPTMSLPLYYGADLPLINGMTPTVPQVCDFKMVAPDAATVLAAKANGTDYCMFYSYVDNVVCGSGLAYPEGHGKILWKSFIYGAIDLSFSATMYLDVAYIQFHDGYKIITGEPRTYSLPEYQSGSGFYHWTDTDLIGSHADYTLLYCTIYAQYEPSKYCLVIAYPEEKAPLPLVGRRPVYQAFWFLIIPWAALLMIYSIFVLVRGSRGQKDSLFIGIVILEGICAPMFRIALISGGFAFVNSQYQYEPLQMLSWMDMVFAIGASCLVAGLWISLLVRHRTQKVLRISTWFVAITLIFFLATVSILNGWVVHLYKWQLDLGGAHYLSVFAEIVKSLYTYNSIVILSQIIVNIFVNICVFTSLVLVMDKVNKTASVASGSAATSSKKLQSRLAMWGVVQVVLVMVLIGLLIQTYLYGFLQAGNRTIMTEELYNQTDPVPWSPTPFFSKGNQQYHPRLYTVEEQRTEGVANSEFWLGVTLSKIYVNMALGTCQVVSFASYFGNSGSKDKYTGTKGASSASSGSSSSSSSSASSASSSSSVSSSSSSDPGGSKV